ncbi:unnamed protein product [Protopolystoma xenopodis]|uniref:Uncharacterized protein n=1 Tax=Protopolystoma xenopodis TaxID=117903 RepID=A0A448WQ66_9PLAT|nr:unnamed protein product [Protopolystoma xenopodis]
MAERIALTGATIGWGEHQKTEDYGGCGHSIPKKMGELVIILRIAGAHLEIQRRHQKVNSSTYDNCSTAGRDINNERLVTDKVKGRKCDSSETSQTWNQSKVYFFGPPV